MPRALAHCLPREIAVLGLIECALSFAVIYALINTASAPMQVPGVFAILLGDVALAAVVTLTIGVVATAIGLYRPNVCLERKRLLAALVLASAVALGVLLLASGGIPDGLGHSFYIAKVLTAWLAALTMIRLVYGFATVRMSRPRRVLILGEVAQIGDVHTRLRSRRGQTFDPVVINDQDVSWALLGRQSIWGIVLASVPEGSVVEALLECKLRGMRILSGTAFNEYYLRRIDPDAMTANDLLLAGRFTDGRLRDLAKRACDIVLGSFMFVLALPMMALIALAIKMGSAGPVFDREQRIGQLGKPFALFKFRSMTADAEVDGDPCWAQKKVPHVTRVGRFLRTTRIDELPQLANVIRGEMSLVGPRPERPHFVDHLERAVRFYRQRAHVKPGLTGWAQVNCPHGASVEDAREKLSYDLYYVKNRTILLDAAILLSTIRVVLQRFSL
jgi:exopolysaccharide biosynthesis polyprenyl glycosylphosphotransferase